MIAKNWLEEVGKRAKIDDVDVVAKVLDEYRIPGGRALLARKQLRLEGVHFAGVKDILVDLDSDER